MDLTDFSVPLLASSSSLSDAAPSTSASSGLSASSCDCVGEDRYEEEAEEEEDEEDDELKRKFIISMNYLSFLIFFSIALNSFLILPYFFSIPLNSFLISFISL